MFPTSCADNNNRMYIILIAGYDYCLSKTEDTRNSGQINDMQQVNFKPLRFETVIIIATAVLLTLSCESSLIAQSSKDNGSRAFFAEKTEDTNDGFASSRKTKSEENSEKEENTKSAQEKPLQTEIRNTEIRNVEDDDPNNRPVTLEEMPDWQLMHSEILPYGDYFIDTRIVGAVRYHADFSLEKEYEITRELSNIQKDLSQYLAIGHPKETIEVFFFASNEKFKKFLAVELPEAPYDRTALYVKQSGPGMVVILRGPDLKEDLRHEMTHAFLHACMPYVPLWLDEGLAEYFEKPRETRARVNPYFTSVSRKVTFNQVPSMTRLEKMKYFDQMGNNEYCEAWSWVHFMIHHSRETHQMLAGYIRLLSEYGEKTPPLEPYLTKTVPDAKKAYLEHFRNWKSRTEVSAKPNASTKQTSVAPVAPEKTPPAEKEPAKSRLAFGWGESLFR